MDWSSPTAVYAQLSLPGVVAALLIVGTEYGLALLATIGLRRGPTATKSSPVRGPGVAGLVLGGLAAFLLSAGLFAAVITLVQVPLQTTLGRWVLAHVATANQAVLALPVVLLSGLVQEPAKVLPAFIGLTLAGTGAIRTRPVSAAAAVGDGVPARFGRLDSRRTLLLGAASGAGFGAFEAAFVLSHALGGAGGVSAGLGQLAMAVPAIIERVSAVLLHLSLTGIAFWAFASGWGRGLAVLAGMSLAHGLVNYVAVVTGGLGGSVALAEILVGVAALTAFAGLVVLGRRPPSRGQPVGRPGTDH